MSLAPSPRNKQIRWCGTVSYMIGIMLTAFDVYPQNLYFQTVGAFCWAIAAFGAKDRPLLVVEGYAFMSYGVGLLYAIVRSW